MPVFKDQTGRTLSINNVPQRIISLVPSQTELLFDLGLDQEVVGITKFCVHPEEWSHTKERVGGTRQLKIDLIHQLNPDLIIAGKEENPKDQIEELGKHYPVWVSDVSNPKDALEMIKQIGLICNKEQQALKMVTRINENFTRLQTPRSRLRTAYIIWQNPFRSIGGDTFIHSMLTASGFMNVFENNKRYPEITLADLKAADCQLIFLSSEPFPFSTKHRNEWQRKLPGTRVILVDGEMFSWYGSRMLLAPEYFNKLLKKIKINN